MTRDVFIRIPFRDSWSSNALYLSIVRGGYYIHIGVGFEVAYLYKVASSKAKT